MDDRKSHLRFSKEDRSWYVHLFQRENHSAKSRIKEIIFHANFQGERRYVRERISVIIIARGNIIRLFC